MKTQEWKDCYVHRNIGIRGSNAKYETGMEELTISTEFCHGKAGHGEDKQDTL